MQKHSKVLLINPPCIELYKDLRATISKFPPLGLAYLASFLEGHNIEVKIYDGFAEDASLDDVEKKIIDTDANLIGITSTTSVIREAIKIAESAKKYNKIVVIGGPHVTALPIETLERYNCFDYGVIGEGELTLYELADGKTPERIDGLVYRKGDKVIQNKKRDLIENLSIIPYPARHLLKNHLYRLSDWFFMKNERFFTIITSRGCPFQCTFCASKTIWGNKTRFRPLNDVFAEIEELKRMGIKQLWILDDIFTLDVQRVKEICKKIKSLNIGWCCNARVDVISAEILNFLKDSNCILIEYGIESGNQKILDTAKKGITLEQIRKALKLTKERGIKTCCSFIIGNIGETEKTTKDTMRLAKELNPDFALFNMLALYPGTEVYEIAKKNRYPVKDFQAYTNPKFFNPVLSLPGMPPKRLKKLLAQAYVGFYLNPKRLLKSVSSLSLSYYALGRSFRFFITFIKICKRYLLPNKDAL